MKKKLEAELISIAHRILKLKNRAELDQLQQETLKLYEKISVLRFVEDNFNDVKPTIGYASAEEKLEDIYGLAEEPQAEEPQGTSHKLKEENEPQAETQDPKPKTQDAEQDKENDKGEGVTAGNNAEEVVFEEEKEATEEAEEEPQATSQQPEEEQEAQNPEPNTQNPEGDADPEQPVEEYQASEEEKEITEEKEEEETESSESQSQSAEETRKEQPETEEAQAPAPKTHNPESSTGFSFDFEPKKEDEPKQKEITFEDYRDYKEPEFVKKGQEPKVEESVPEPANVQKEWLPKEPEVIAQQEENARDWRDWEPAKDEPKAEEKPQATSQQPEATSLQSQSQSADSNRNPQRETRSLNLGLNDRIAFEKNLFGGSGEDLNRVISQLNTFDTFDEAKEFIADMVKPDYNNWQGKEEYEERFLALVEKKFD